MPRLTVMLVTDRFMGGALMVKQPGDDECAPLTARLADMLWARGYGWSYDEIGILHGGIKGGTVRGYLRQARLRLDCDTVGQAVEEAARLGIIDLTLPEPEYPRWMAPRGSRPEEQP